MSGLLENKTAIIYGAGGAIGGGVARAFAREGAHVAAVARTVYECGAATATVIALLDPRRKPAPAMAPASSPPAAASLAPPAAAPAADPDEWELAAGR